MKTSISPSSRGQKNLLRAALALGCMASAGTLLAQQSSAPIQLPPYHPGKTLPVFVIAGFESATDSSPQTSTGNQPVQAKDEPQIARIRVEARADEKGGQEPRISVIKLNGPDGEQEEIEVRVQIEEPQKPSAASQIQRRGDGNKQEIQIERRVELQQRREQPSSAGGRGNNPPQNERAAPGGDRENSQRSPLRPTGPQRGNEPGPGGPGRMGPPGMSPFGSGRAGGPPAGMNRGPSQGPSGDDMQRQVESFDRILESSTVKRILQLMEENIELKAEMRVQEIEVQARRELEESRVSRLLEEAQKMQREAHEQMVEAREMQEHARREMEETHQHLQAEEAEMDRVHKMRGEQGRIPEEVARELDSLRAERNELHQMLRRLEEELQKRNAGGQQAERATLEARAIAEKLHKDLAVAKEEAVRAKQESAKARDQALRAEAQAIRAKEEIAVKSQALEAKMAEMKRKSSAAEQELKRRDVDRRQDRKGDSDDAKAKGKTKNEKPSVKD